MNNYAAVTAVSKYQYLIGLEVSFVHSPCPFRGVRSFTPSCLMGTRWIKVPPATYVVKSQSSIRTGYILHWLLELSPRSYQAYGWSSFIGQNKPQLNLSSKETASLLMHQEERKRKFQNSSSDPQGGDTKPRNFQPWGRKPANG